MLPDGTPADALYLVLSEPYREILNHAPVRPLDYAYLQALTPMAQRFYELLSYHDLCDPDASPAARDPALWRVLPARDPAAAYGRGHPGQKTDVQSPPAAPGGGVSGAGPV